MGKGPKLQHSFMNSIQICRPKYPSSLVKSPLPTLTHFSTLNSQNTYDISLPSFPDPPPSPPDHLSTKSNVESSKITHKSKSCILHEIASNLSDEFPSHKNSITRKDNKEKLCSSSFSSVSNERACTIPHSRIEKKNEKTTTKKPKAKVKSTSISLADNDETDHSLSPSPSSHGFNDNPLRTNITEEESKKLVKRTSVRTRRFRRYGSKEWKDGSIIERENEGREQKPVSMVNYRKVNQSFVVVKRSVDPYEDFKNSMLEMILEKQMFEPKELEHLLMSFLSLNSRMHHNAILKAFTEIWKEVFSGSTN